MPRDHHSHFAKRMLPGTTFSQTEKVFTELKGPQREAFLMFMWNEAGKAAGSPLPHVAVTDGKLAKLEVVGAIQQGGHEVIVLSMPPALEPNEAAFIALARGVDGGRVFFLERCMGDGGQGVHPEEAVLSEVRPDGSRINHGFAPGLDLEAFKRRVGGVLGISLDGIERSLPEITAAAFMAAGGARKPGATAAGAAGKGVGVGALLATLLLLRFGLPLLSFVLGTIGLGSLMFSLWPVLQYAYPLLSLAIGISLLVWLYQVHKARREQAPMSPGWAVGGWFIPVANFILAPLSIRSAWKAVGLAGGTLIAFGWWFLWLLETVNTSLRSANVSISKGEGDLHWTVSIAGERLPGVMADIVMFGTYYGHFVSMAAYGLLWYIVKRVNERV